MGAWARCRVGERGAGAGARRAGRPRARLGGCGGCAAPAPPAGLLDLTRARRGPGRRGRERPLRGRAAGRAVTDRTACAAAAARRQTRSLMHCTVSPPIRARSLWAVPDGREGRRPAAAQKLPAGESSSSNAPRAGSARAASGAAPGPAPLASLSVPQHRGRRAPGRVRRARGQRGAARTRGRLCPRAVTRGEGATAKGASSAPSAPSKPGATHAPPLHVLPVTSELLERRGCAVCQSGRVNFCAQAAHKWRTAGRGAAPWRPRGA